MSYLTESMRPRSEKITLVTAESVVQLKLFTANGSDWDRVVDYFVVGVKEDGVVITSWSYTPTTKTLKIIGGTNPKTRKISVTYRHFFSNAAINLPYDLSTGEAVEWEARVTTIGSIGSQLDEESTGIVLESSSSVTLINNDGFFDSTFDTHIWENQVIKFYSYISGQVAQLFEGVIESKSYSSTQVSFKVKDFVFKLKNQVTLETFKLSDGIVLPSILYTPKRRIYGQVDNLKCVSLDATLDGYVSVGTISVSNGSLSATGISTLFLDYVSPGDEVFLFVDEIKYTFGVESIESNTSLTLNNESEYSYSNKTFYIKPATPWRKKNRTWSVAGHKLRNAQATILTVQSANTFIVDTTVDMYAGDEIQINGIPSVIRRISGDRIVTATNIIPIPSISDIVSKRPIKNVFIGTRELVYGRDYSEVNTTEAKVVLLEDAEFNVTEQRTTSANLVFTTGSRIITTSATVDLGAILKPRDWIRSSNASRTDWYEILSVSSQRVIVRIPVSYSGTEPAHYKSLDVIDENTLFTVNCLGMESLGSWIKRPSDAVRDMIINDAGFSVVNEVSFTKAKTDCDFILSIAIPESLGQKAPLIRDVITLINNSCFGSLYGNASQGISYSILNATKPETADVIRDDDIISFSVETTQKIANKIILKYRPYIDIFADASSFLTIEFDSEFVNDLIGINNTIERTVYLYETDKVEVIAQRIALFNSLSSSSVKIKASINLAAKTVNDKVFLSLDRLYNRYGGLDRRKIGTITGVKRDGYGTEISVTDLGNIYNRVPSIAPNTSLDYSNATSDDKIRWGYVLDNDTVTPDSLSEEGLGNYIIG